MVTISKPYCLLGRRKRLDGTDLSVVHRVTVGYGRPAELWHHLGK